MPQRELGWELELLGTHGQVAELAERGQPDAAHFLLPESLTLGAAYLIT